MSSIKDIRRRMTNVRTIGQVLKAMNMVSSTKLQKAKLRLDGIRPLHGELQNVIGDLKHFEEVRAHIFAMPREVKNTAYIVITSDKGLCGSYNINVCEKALEHMGAGKNQKIFVVGARGYQYFRRRGKESLHRIADFSEAQIYESAAQLSKMVTTMFTSKEVDEVYIAYTYFESTLSHPPRVEKILPISDESGVAQRDSGMTYEPDVISFLEHVMPLYLHTYFFAAFSQSLACEHAARMVNMESATNNANELIDELKNMYNRKRQAAITQELTEIVSGANILQ